LTWEQQKQDPGRAACGVLGAKMLLGIKGRTERLAAEQSSDPDWNEGQ
jgi:hypothetical protein